jgi:hypothetical protein
MKIRAHQTMVFPAILRLSEKKNGHASVKTEVALDYLSFLSLSLALSSPLVGVTSHSEGPSWSRCYRDSFEEVRGK